MTYFYRTLGAVVCLLFAATVFAEPKTITFSAKDGIVVTGDLYLHTADKSAPFIVLFHQAGWSRGEYLAIAPRLNQMGFNCLAVDQRSGKEVNGVVNETAQRAIEAGKDVNYLDALADIEAALVYARKRLAAGKLIAWGSSYSASLALWIAGTQPKLTDGVLAFAPGEYFTRFGKSPTWVQEAAANIENPVFVTSARHEEGEWLGIYKAIKSATKTAYLPPTAGNHGSRALWEGFADSGGYWTAVTEFLEQFQ